MTTRAYILIETSVGSTRNVADELRGLSAVQSVDSVTGPFDIIAVVDAADLNAVGDIVTGRIHKIDGIVRTVTCLTLGTA